MKKTAIFVRSFLCTLLGIGILTVTPAAAHSSESHSGDSKSSETGTTTTAQTAPSSTVMQPATTTSESTQSKSGRSTTKVESESAKSRSSDDSQTQSTSEATESENETHHITADDSLAARAEHLTGVQSQAQADLQKAREKHKEHSTEERQKVCSERQTNINSRISRLGQNAQKHLTSFDAVLSKVEAYQTKAQLDVPTYASLAGTATINQATATTAVGALSSLTVTIDCSSTDPAASLATVKVAANSAKSTLQTYRSAIKAIITALEAAKSNTAAETEASN